MVKYWNSLPREAVDIPSLRFQIQVKQGFENTDLMKDVPAFGRSVGLNGL